MQQKPSQFCRSFLISLFLSLFAFPIGILANTAPHQFPATAVETLRQDLSQHTGIAAEKLKLVETVQKTWPNGCLGLAKPDELCSQALVDGWQITLSDGIQKWNYHTDMSGQTYRLAETNH